MRICCACWKDVWTTPSIEWASRQRGRKARQLVSHKAIEVNDVVVNIPSYQVAAGDKIEIREKAKSQMRIKSALDIATQVGLPEWVDVDEKKLSGVLRNLPEREDVLPDINENLVVELYSK